MVVAGQFPVHLVLDMGRALLELTVGVSRTQQQIITNVKLLNPMIDTEKFRKVALSLPETTEEPHFEKTSFRVKKKIFATLDLKMNRACIKLSEVDQSVFSSIGSSILYPVPNKWGKQGWTFLELDKLNEELLKDSLKCAYNEVTKKKK